MPSDYEARLVKMDFAVGRRKPRTHSGRVDQALRLQDGEALAASFRQQLTGRLAPGLVVGHEAIGRTTAQ